MKKKLLTLTLSALVLLTSYKSNAYDVDTHFYGTYSLARFAGIRHEVALKIATSAQWMDESYISDPLSMIILPDVGIKKRRLLHFPGSRIANKLTVDTLPTIIDPSSKVKLRTFTETEADHEFATEMLNEGMMSGDLMMVGTGLHTLEDSFAHAGTIAELGHAHFWHHPDRPYVDEASVTKYFKMTRSVLKAMVAMRMLLPANAVDTTVQFGEKPNYQQNGEKLADIYEQIPEVRSAVSRKILNMPEFVDFALKDVFGRARRVNYVKDGYQPYLKNYTAGEDAYTAAANIAKTMPQEMINVAQIMKDSGRPTLTADYVLSLGGLKQVLTKVVTDLMAGIVPRPLDVYHRFEKEEDGPVWIKEIDLRVGNMRALIQKIYGKNIEFVGNKTNTQAGYIKEMTKQPEAKPVLPANAQAGVEYVTYSLDEKYRFNHMIFRFMFPKLATYLKGDFAKIDQIIQLNVSQADGAATDASLMQKARSLWNTPNGIMAALSLITDIPNIYRNAREDITHSRITPLPTNRYYTLTYLMDKQIKANSYKSLMTPQQVESLAGKK